MNECIFCNIINKKIPAEFIYENDSVVAFPDIHPKAPIHILIVPREHIISVNDLRKEHAPLITALMLAAPAVAEKLEVKGGGYKLAFNVGKGGGQMVDHIHMHLLAWPAGNNNEEAKKEVFHL